MKILVLTKRHHMDQDALAQLHGRTFAIPEALACRGHQVHGLVANYHPERNMALRQPNPASKWVNIDVRSGVLPRFDRYLSSLSTTIHQFRPDIIWAGSDALIVAAGVRAAKKAGIPCILDLKDNYEAFSLSRIPIIKHQLHNAISNATAITCVSEALRDYAIGLGASQVLHLPNAAGEIFYFQPKNIVRQSLNLPQNLFLIGTAGSLTKSRGIYIFSEALSMLSEHCTNFGVLIAGPRDKSWDPSLSAPIFDLGKIPVAQVPFVFNALDIGIICNINSKFGSHCYPQKFHEMQACGLPVIASRIGPFATPQLPVGLIGTFSSSSELADMLIKIVTKPFTFKSRASPETWTQRAIELEKFMYKTLETHNDIR